MSNFMIFDKETGQKIADGKGLVLPSDKPGAINSKPEMPGDRSLTSKASPAEAGPPQEVIIL